LVLAPCWLLIEIKKSALAVARWLAATQTASATTWRSRARDMIRFNARHIFIALTETKPFRIRAKKQKAPKRSSKK